MMNVVGEFQTSEGDMRLSQEPVEHDWSIRAFLPAVSLDYRSGHKVPAQ